VIFTRSCKFSSPCTRSIPDTQLSARRHYIAMPGTETVNPKQTTKCETT